MYRELDLAEAERGTTFGDLAALAWRLLDVAFYDVQLVASLAHGNRCALFNLCCFYVLCLCKFARLRNAPSSNHPPPFTSTPPQLNTPLPNPKLPSMMEAATQLNFRGYEEARVALTALAFTLPAAAAVGIEYAVFNRGALVLNVKVCVFVSEAPWLRGGGVV
jgi:hypothetical protein